MFSLLLELAKQIYGYAIHTRLTGASAAPADHDTLHHTTMILAELLQDVVAKPTVSYLELRFTWPAIQVDVG